jgi:hypothetical protein
MAGDDWRVRVELPEEDYAGDLLARLGIDLGSEARLLAQELEDRRLPVSRDANVVFVHASSASEAELARDIVEAELREDGVAADALAVERWLEDEERWSDEPPGRTFEEDLLARGYAPWEVRIERSSHGEASELADRLEEEGYDVVRRWRYLIVGAGSRAEADELARRLHGEVEPGGELVWEVIPQNPFAIFGGLGGSGTPL